MAGKGSKKDIESVLMQAMLAAKTVRAQRDHLLQLQQRLQELQADAAPAVVEADADAKLKELASNLFKVYYIGLEAGARILTTCVHLAAEKDIRFSPPNLAFAVMPDEQLHDALLAQQFPARPRPSTASWPPSWPSSCWRSTSSRAASSASSAARPPSPARTPTPPRPTAAPTGTTTRSPP
uniref:Uncharacterized protein n=1 Tax=Triticum urartu TaxID=4572 RepID=A0A8R7PYE9_TRIUA